MRNRPTTTSSRHKASEAAGLDCATAFQKMTLDCVADIKAHHTQRVRRRCRGRASDPGRDHAVARRRGVLRADRGRCGMAAAEEGNRLAERPARRRARQRCRHGICAPQAIRRVGAAHDRRALDQRQMQDHRRLVRCLRSARTQRLVAAMAGWIRQGPWLARYKRRNDAEALQSYCARELDRWHERLVRKGRHLKTLGASRRHRLRIKAKRFRYMLEALTETVALWGRSEFHRPAPAGKTIAARIGRHARSRALRRPCRRIAAGRKWQTRQEASAGLSPSKGKAARRRHRGSSRPQARRSPLTPPSACASARTLSGFDVRQLRPSARRLPLPTATGTGAESPRECVGEWRCSGTFWFIFPPSVRSGR